MIYLITGQPGHGKTLRALELAVEFQRKGREVFASGVRGLNYSASGFHPLPDPKKWEELPDNSVVLLDECYTVFPRRAPGAKVPGYIEAMATHRHRGFDFIMVCQKAKGQLDTFLEGLIDRHEHIRRKWGLKKSVILWWDRYSENIKSSDTKKIWSFPKKIMDRKLYESTVEDHTQVKFPWYVIALPFVILGIVYSVHVFRKSWSETSSGAAVKGSEKAKDSALGGSSGGSSVNRRPDDLVKFLTPRIPGEPWSAPAYDGRPIASDPEVYCVAVDDGSCGCVTEQGTKYELSLKLCRSIASDGAYNPTRRPAQQQRQDRSDRDQAETARRTRSSVQAADVGGSAGPSTAWPAGVGKDYVPPATPGSWDPTPVAGGSNSG